jgi:hypothetical protein
VKDHPIAGGLIADAATGGLFTSTVAATSAAIGLTVTATGITFYATSIAVGTTLQATFSSLDYTSAMFKGNFNESKKQFLNAVKIDAGLIMSSPDEFGQTMLGNSISHLRNASGNVTNVELGWNYVLVNDENSSEWQGMTLGSYINGWGIDSDYKHDPIFVHEFGHTIQSKLIGPYYMTKVGVPSGLSGYLAYYTNSGHDHNTTWFEINANQNGQLFYTPDYAIGGSSSEEYPRSYRDIDNNWFMLFNPFLF